MFKFAYKSVLDYRQQIEDIKQQDFSRHRRILEREQRKLEEIYLHWQTNMQNWREQQKQSFSIASIELYQKYMVMLKLKIAEQAQRVKELLDEVDKKRAEVVEAQKNRKVIEFIEKKERDHYVKEYRKKETKQLDDLAVQGFVYRGKKA